FFPVRGGNIRVQVDPSVPAYERLARSAAYGHDVLVRGPLLSAAPARNPGGFVQQLFLRNHHVFGSMRLRGDARADAPIAILHPDGAPPRRGAWIVSASLALRDRLLRVIKLTVPYPDSAFLGAVSLGLRYGLQDVRCPFPGDEGTCGRLVAEEFRHAGINHVLAVSGLHVTILTIFFVALFSLLRISRRAYVPVVIAVLVIFAIITGARPSTLRAVIMNGLFLLTWGYLGQGLRASVLLGAPVAAFLILLQNPAMLVDPSFTLSFGAILSLALLTPPFQALLNRLHGNDALVALLLWALLTAATIMQWALLLTWRFWVPAVLFGVALTRLGRWAARRGWDPLGPRGFVDLPIGISSFLAAQLGIQVGMMLPLSAYYFFRWPVAGAYANLVAIPLIGVILQWGILAGLLGLIPVIGLYPALLLNAANYLAIRGFLWIGHLSATVFPWPFLPRPSEATLLCWYALLAIFIWRRPLRARLHPRLRRATGPVLAALALLLAAGIAVTWLGPRHPAGRLRLTLLDVEYGSALLIQTPDGRAVLVDAGPASQEPIPRNAAERTILPVLSHLGLQRLDGLILTALRPERVGGAAYLLDHMPVDHLWLPAGLADLEPATGRAAAARQLGLDRHPDAAAETALDMLFSGSDSLAAALARRRPAPLTRWAGVVTRAAPLAAGATLYASSHDGQPFAIEVLADGRGPDTPYPSEDHSAVLRIRYGAFAVLIGGALHFNGQRQLLAAVPADRLRADVLIYPGQTTQYPAADEDDSKAATLHALDSATAPLLAAVKPSWILHAFGNPRPILGVHGRSALRARELTLRFLADRFPPERLLSTDRHMALFVESDGRSLQVFSQRDRLTQAAEADADDEVSDLEVGF
ncbi:MAG: ComEC/Rec2 family competence protein, partial [Candidatus Marinimicrobia bacterium]|nr:ComEC/Rec2 family competence protein [Candidatus Neomarinimicrobiota bacterium]